MSKWFTLAEAQSLLPLLERLLREAVAAKAEYETAARQFGAFQQRVAMMGGVVFDPEAPGEARRQRDTAAARLRAALERVQETGCVVKDLDIGLIDFPTKLRGVEVYLCWKLGEPDIQHWHGVDEGFRGRKRIDQDFLDNHGGGRAN